MAENLSENPRNGKAEEIMLLLNQQYSIDDFLYSNHQKLQILVQNERLCPSVIDAVLFSKVISTQVHAPKLWNPNMSSHPPAPTFEEMREGELELFNIRKR